MSGNVYLFPKNQKKTAQLWTRFMTDRLKNYELTPYEKGLVSEWERFKQFNVNIYQKSGILLPDEEFQKALERNHDLINKSTPVLCSIASLLDNVPLIIVLADSNGTILKVFGDAKIREKARQVNFSEGGSWSEHLSGNNGIGTAIQKKNPVHVFSSEHFCEQWQSFSCAGSPILNSYTGEILGVVDITTCASDFKDDALGLAHSLANQIQLVYKVEWEAEQFNLINTFLKFEEKYSSEGIIVVDSGGNSIRKNEKAQELVSAENISEDMLSSEKIAYEMKPIHSVHQNTMAGKVFIIKNRKPAKLFSSSIPAYNYSGYLTRNRQVVELFAEIEKVARVRIPVLLTGETGTGKELAAYYIHEQSPYSQGPFVAVNCGNISKELFGSSFFGYERGAFTGADPGGRRGLFEQADGGTLFLDEIAEMPLEFQAALLRVIEQKRISRLGSEKEKEVDFRLVSASNRNLLNSVEQGTFRVELFYRLKGAQFQLPPLRERAEDLEYLLHYFIAHFCDQHGFQQKTVDESALSILLRHKWEGNVRELKNTVETMVVLAQSSITAREIPQEIRRRVEAGQERQQESRQKHHEEPAQQHPLNKCSPADSSPEAGSSTAGEYDTMIRLLNKHHHIYQVANELGISRSTLYRRLKKLGIDPGKHRPARPARPACASLHQDTTTPPPEGS